MWLLRLPRWQLIALLLLVGLSVLMINQPALADDGILQGDTISGDSTVENDVLLNGTDINLAGTVAGDVLIVGQNINVSGEIQGSLIAIGQNIAIDGEVQGSVYSIGVSLNLLSGAAIDHNLNFLGISLVTEKDSEIGRDLNGVALGARLAGTVGRNPGGVFGLLEIGRLVMDSMNGVTTGGSISGVLPTGSLNNQLTQLGGEPIFAGALSPAGTANMSQNTSLVLQEGSNPQANTSNTFNGYLNSILQELITLLVIGGILIWLFPKRLDDWANQLRSRVLASAGWGFVAYIVGFVAVLIAFLLILVIGISFAFVTLWGLAWTWWSIGLFSLGLAFALFLLAVTYVSKIIVAYWIGRLILERFGSSPDMRKPWPLLLGLILYVLLCSIPFLGWAVSLIVTFLGLGAIWLAFQNRQIKMGNDSAG